MFCYESGFENYVPRRASADGVNIDDPKTLNNLIQVSRFYEPNPKYLELIQRDSFTTNWRKILIEWMFEIADDCEDGVFPHAVNLLDRYLSKSNVESPRDELQVIGAVCLFLASKLRENQPIPVDRLCENSGYAYTSKQVREWEIRVLNALNWDTSAVLPHDLLDHFLHRLPIPVSLRTRVTGHARTLINMCCTEYVFLPHSSKMMATACLYDAVFGLGPEHMELRRTFPELMGKFIDIDKEELCVIHGKIRALVTSVRGESPPAADPEPCKSPSPPPNHTPYDALQLDL